MQATIVNSVLISLPEHVRSDLLEGARLVRLRRNRILYDHGERSMCAYFIETGLASVLVETMAGEQVEVGMIGSEGMVGISTLLGSQPNVTRCTMQLDSSAYEVRMEKLTLCFEKHVVTRKLLLEFTQTYLYSTQRVAACNRVHLAPERLVRWLLMAYTYSHMGQLPFTHEYLAQMVAVQRTTVSAALNALQADGLLEHGWGTVVIKDRVGLEKKACSCYRVLQQLHANLYKAPDTTQRHTA